MNIGDALRNEIENTPEPLLREAYDFLLFLKNREVARGQESETHKDPPRWPDFRAQLKAIYGDRMGKDSQEIMDYLREERG